MPRLPLAPRPQTFLDLPAAAMPVGRSVAIFGAVHGTPYGSDPAESEAETGPDAVRRAITAACLDVGHWDFDFDGPLLNDEAIEVFDLGDVTTAHGDAPANRRNIEAVASAVLAAQATPVLIGGDDSVAIPFMHAFTKGEALHLLQIDAHIDWRDHIDGERLGYSSTIRRASELGCVTSMTQCGIRAVGSARRQEVEAARAWGSNIVTVAEARRQGMAAVAAALPRDRPLLIHIDCDAMDPGTCPGVNALAPGGFAFHEMTELIGAAMRGRRLAGFSIVEFQPKADVNDITATVVGRLVCHVLGHLARTA